MRLTLEITQGPGAGDARLVDGMRPFTVGTRPGAIWVLPSAAGEHGLITLRAAPQGFSVEAEGNVTLEGQPVGDGMTRALGHGSGIEIAGVHLRATIAQQHAPSTRGFSGLSDAPTISAILSDVAPGGMTASGPLPGRTGEDWLESLFAETPSAQSRSPQGDAVWGTLGLYGASDAAARDPILPRPTPASPLSGSYLPDDWDTPGNPQNRTTQAQVQTGALSIGIRSDRDQMAEASPADALRLADPAIRAFIRAADILPEELTGPLEAQMQQLGVMLRTLMDGLARIEAAQVRALAEVAAPQSDASWPPAQTLDTSLLLTVGSPEQAAAQINQRVERLAGWPLAVIAAMRSCISEARDQLDPVTVSAELATSGAGLRARVTPAAAAWSAYRQRWAVDDPAARPLSDAALAQALLRHLNTDQKMEPPQ
jgi:type VI secretion system protein ImpI